MRFAKDTRLKEVRRLFRSSHVFTVHYAHEDGAEDLVAGQQLRLLLHANKYLARTLARGMFTLGTDTQLKPLFSESVPIPELCTTAKFRPQGTTVALDLTPHPDLVMSRVCAQCPATDPKNSCTGPSSTTACRQVCACRAS